MKGMNVKMKNVLMGIATTVALLVGVYLIGTGLMKMPNVFVGEHSLSEDGMTMEISAGVATSMGYIRDVAVKREGEKVYLTFYSTFGGLNSSLGARSEFSIPLDEASGKIYVYRGGNDYELILRKNAETGEWEWN